VRSTANARTTSLSLEYGAVSFSGILRCVATNLTLHADTGAAQRTQLKLQIRAAFYCDQEIWCGMVLGRARVTVLQALIGLRQPD